MADQAREEFLGAFKSLLESGDYSDFVIVCGSDTYNVHKAVVCTRSGFFKGKERFAADQEAASGKADLSEDEPAIVKLLVQYLYEGEYDLKISDMISRPDSFEPVVTVNKAKGSHYSFPHTCKKGCPTPQYKVCHHHECRPETCGESCVDWVCTKCCPSWAPPTSKLDASHLLLHAKMYEIGDKYDVNGLKQLSLTKFSLVCNEHWRSPQFAQAAHHAFSTTPEDDKGLRDIVTKTIADHMDMLNSPEVEALLHECNGLAVSLLTMRAKELGWIKRSG